MPTVRPSNSVMAIVVDSPGNAPQRIPSVTPERHATQSHGEERMSQSCSCICARTAIQKTSGMIMLKPNRNASASTSTATKATMKQRSSDARQNCFNRIVIVKTDTTSNALSA